MVAKFLMWTVRVTLSALPLIQQHAAACARPIIAPAKIALALTESRLDPPYAAAIARLASAIQAKTALVLILVSPLGQTNAAANAN